MSWGTCHWCGRGVDSAGWHHEANGRVCCRRCYNAPDSNYRKVYGPSADAEDEVREAQRARRAGR